MTYGTHPKLIGILGGMGPLATVDFLEKVIRATPASQDQDHVPMIVHHVPQIPNRNLAVLDGHDAPFEPMLSGLRTLQRSGADAIAIPCNTAHAWFDRLAQETQVPLIHIADAVAQNVRKRGSGTSEVVLLATRGTIAAGIYTSRANGIADRIILPEDTVQVRIERIILAVKAGRIGEARDEASRVAEHLLSGQGDRLLLLACTELPIAFETSRFSSHLIDSSQALAEACIACSIGLQRPDVPHGRQPPTSAGP
jgi:aspartate racemase